MSRKSEALTQTVTKMSRKSEALTDFVILTPSPHTNDEDAYGSHPLG